MELGDAFADPVPQRIHALRDKPAYPGAPGRARQVLAGDGPLFADWLTAFSREAVPDDPVSPRAEIEKVAGEGRHMFWVVDDEPVSMAGIVRRTRSAAAIAAVYTPPAQRGRGFAGSVTAAVAERALRRRQGRGLPLHRSQKPRVQPLLCQDRLQARLRRLDLSAPRAQPWPRRAIDLSGRASEGAAEKTSRIGRETMLRGLAAVVAATLLMAAQSAPAAAEASTLRAAKQYGLGYVQYMLMEDLKLVEKRAKAAGLGDITRRVEHLPLLRRHERRAALRQRRLRVAGRTGADDHLGPHQGADGRQGRIGAQRAADRA